ncbi:hypothetical protein WJX77_001821 [Trebouxia sp. C0004]
MAELELLSAQLRCGSSQQRALTWQKLVSLGESGLEGEKVAKSGLVPVLVAMLEQRPSRRTEVQQQAASLLLEAAGSDAGTEALMAMDCIPRLTTALQSGSFIKKSKVTAILGLLSTCTMLKDMECNSMPHHHASLMSTTAVPEVVRVLSQAGCKSDPACTAMILMALEAMLLDPSSLHCFVKAGGVQVIDKLMVHMPSQLSSSFLVDDDSVHVGLWAAGEDVWVPALGVLSQVAKYSTTGAQIILEGPLLSLLLQCCSSSSCGVQLLALTALLSLAAVPDNLPAFAKAGQVIHLAAAMHSSSPTVQEQALQCIKLLSPTFNGGHEELVISAMESLTACVQDSNSVMGESLESCSDDDDESLMECGSA